MACTGISDAVSGNNRSGQAIHKTNNEGAKMSKQKQSLWQLKAQAKNKVSGSRGVMRNLRQQRCFAVTPAMLLAGAMSVTAANGSPVDRTEPGIRAMAMSGAFVAQADDSSAMWYNPAGLGSFITEEGSRVEFSTIYGDKIVQASDEQDEGGQLSVLWARAGHRFAFALGGYDTSTIAITLPATLNSAAENVTLGAYDLSMAFSFAVDDLLLGTTMGLTSLTPYEQSGYEDLDESSYSWQVGARYLVLSQYIDVFDTSLLFELDAAGLYRSEVKVQVFRPLVRHAYQATEFTARPQAITGGLRAGLGWISEMVIWKLHLNADHEISTYSDMAVFLVDPAATGDVDLERTALGAELVMSLAESNWQFSLRGGAADQQSDFDNFNETVVSVGAGVKYKRATFEVAAQRVEPSASSSSLPKDFLSAGISFTW